MGLDEEDTPKKFTIRGPSGPPNSK